MRPGGALGPAPLGPDDPAAVGPYRLLGRLGAGGMGQVYLGRSTGGRMVALKVVRGDLAREPEFRLRFRAEVRAARRVGGLWTAPVLDSDTESAVPWVATGYVAGPPLRQVVESLHGPLPATSVWALAFGLALALRDIHGSDLIHRDLKPSNVMVTLEGPKVIDFGIARAADASVVTRTGSLVGSPGYMPPEQIRGDQLGGATDVFALGAVLAYAATGRAPFSWDGASTHTVLYRVLHEEPQLGPSDGPLHGELRALVARCLAKDPGLRPTVDEIEAVARERSGDDFWLPAALTARLGQDAAALLDFDAPVSGPPAWGSPTPPGTPPPAPYRSASPPPGFPPSADASPPPGVSPPPAAAPTFPPNAPAGTTAANDPARRRRSVLAAVAGVAALVVAVPLIVLAASGDDGGTGDETGGTAAEDPDGPAGGADGPSDDAPLAGLLPAEAREAGELTFWVTERHNPVLYEEDGEPVGFEMDLAVAMAQRLGVEAVFTLTDDRPTAVEGALRNSAETPGHVVMSGFTDTAERRRDLGLDFVNHFGDGFAVMSDDPQRSGELAELCGLRVTSYDDAYLQEVVTESTAHCAEPVELLPVPSRDDMVEALQENEADVAVLLYSQGARYLHEHPGTGLTVALDSAERGFRGVGVPPDQTTLRDAVAEAIDLLIEDGTYATLLDRWGIPECAIDTASVNGGGGGGGDD
ncbi:MULTISPECIES: serine/threonine-protein kinase [Streptomyces]|nr:MULTISPECIES: serine/threonine-protein kinase [Streptomyces]